MTTSIMESMAARRQGVDEARADTRDADRTPLYRIGGIAALIVVLLIPIQMIVFSV